MNHKTILFPDWLDRIIHALTIIPILTTELIHFLLTPFVWMKFKFHVATFVMCAGLGCCWYFTDKKHAFVVASAIFVLITVAIAVVKWLRKRLKKIDERLLYYFHLYPLAHVEINIPTINKKISSEEKNYEKADNNHYNNPYHKHYCDTVRSDSDSHDNT